MSSSRAQRPENSHPGCRVKRESWCRHRFSIATPVFSQQLGTAFRQHLLAIDLAEPAEKIRHFRRSFRALRHQTGNHTPTLRDLDFFSLMQETLDLLECVPKVANGGRFHVIHFSITLCRSQRAEATFTARAQVANDQKFLRTALRGNSPPTPQVHASRRVRARLVSHNVKGWLHQRSEDRHATRMPGSAS